MTKLGYNLLEAGETDRIKGIQNVGIVLLMLKIILSAHINQALFAVVKEN